MKVDELLSTARDAITVRRVFSEPYETDGVTVIMAASVLGGVGGGTGQDGKGQDGEGGGLGVAGRPAGAYVIRDGTLSWHPAVDPNRLVAVVGLVVVAFVLSRPRMERARASRQ